MAKDPAFLFYTQDFLTGTGLMTPRQKGYYITLLCYQHQNICLSHEDVMKIMEDDYDNDWKVIRKKFRQDENGDWYNERLRVEADKRRSYCESRGNNKKGKKKNNIISNSYDSHMEDENDNVNTNCILLEDTLPKKLLKYKEEPDNWRLDVSKFLKDQKFKQDFCIAKSIKLPDLEKRMADFVVDLNLKMDYKDCPAIKRHFINHYRKYVENGGVGINGKSKGFIDVPKDLDYESQTL